ncbi:non-canonical purine NTP pyrophosphatase [Streptomyces caniscabiei]|uniref:Non-canonical purine NTP pyrophosphatase n=2 Tax=Streptomyces caniscabiei TaxID=2746961 RepID=A0ABU4MXI6_9ACTN|nr:non-canonical purine NTP pyrophosphatase [Streptomyces caniscabiei]MBE4741419.1 xanthosine triphosphate pyrophosphatase [Streptomyces caniscabiei]MBE4761607.1 xanthosine triphosphate pyrophosphatase [Streptomyces caniscabiei]MBE4789981.1 xanthosine triphosphate pyrophosphatase [Streptomyces caniscabiei]MBE4799256.1 xanthosine triphosphate pyrophosphatase [Streptomyces caniscabiei]MDX2990727.1 non-canonical purine NTP pyrophosphatase [Streptomyces caniscabiei]
MPGITVAMCTGNGGKYRTAQEHLAPWGVEVEQVALELNEIQTTSVAKIAEHKARQAYAILGQPLFVEDSGFYIEEFAGWPGPMVKQALEAFGPAGFTHLADLTEKRTCRFASAAVYADADGELHTFADDTREPGTIAMAPDRGHGSRSWSDLWSIFVPKGATATLAALPEDEQNRVFAEWGKRSVVAALGEWLAQPQRHY